MRHLALSLLLLTALLASPARAELLYATNGSSISRFESIDPNAGVTTVPLTGLQGGETLVGIDVRPLDGRIYGVGTTSRVYRIDPVTGVATPVAAAAFSPALNGTSFGTDFNPAVDRIRVVSNTEQNLRINPLDGTVAAADGLLNPAGNVVASAYSGNLPGAATTTLYGIDSAAGALVIQNPPNTGTITTTGSLGLGTNLNENLGLDISGRSGSAYATITTGGMSRLYTVDLGTGGATLVDTIGNGGMSFRGVSVSAPAFLRGVGPAAAAGEGGTLQFRVVREGSPSATTVQYATTNGTARAGEDFTTTTGTLTWAAGDTSERTVDVPVTEDAAAEDAESFGLALSSPGPDTQIVGAEAVATIAASDPASQAPGPAPSPSPTPQPADRTAPVLAVTAAGTQKLAAVRRKGIAAAVAATERCLLQVEAKLSARDAKRLKIGRAIARAVAIAPVARLSVRLELTAKASRAVRRVRRVPVVIGATCEDTAGNRSVAAVARVTLKR